MVSTGTSRASPVASRQPFHTITEVKSVMGSTSKGIHRLWWKTRLGVSVGSPYVQLALIEFDLNGVVANVVRVRMVSESMRINAPPR